MADGSEIGKKGAPRGRPFSKGAPSANPRGRPACAAEIREIARKHGPEAMQTLIDIMRNPDIKTELRIRASDSLLDRGYGKAPQSLTGEGGEGPLQVEVRDLRGALAAGAADAKPAK